jgi:hypothetical protein
VDDEATDKATTSIKDGRHFEFPTSFFGLTLPGLLRRATRTHLPNLFDNKSLLNQATTETWRPEAERGWFYRYSVEILSCRKQLVVDRFLPAQKVSSDGIGAIKNQEGG